MIPAEGAPAERRLGKIARAHYKRALPVGEVEENLGALSRLGVFVGDVVNRDVVADVQKMLQNRIPDGNLPKFGACALNQTDGVFVGAPVVPKPGMVTPD